MEDRKPSEEGRGTEWRPLGPHRYRVQGNRLSLQSNGHVEAEHARTLSDAIGELRVQYGHVSVLIDVRNSTGPTPEARRELSELFQSGTQPVRIAIFGAPAAIRVVAILMQTAIRIRYGAELSLRFFDNEAAAEAWLVSAALPPGK